MSAKTGNLFTDCAVNILDSKGTAVRTNAFDGLEADVGISLPAGADEATFTLQVVGAFAIAEDMEEWGFDLEEKFSVTQPVAGKAVRDGGGPLHLHCGVPTEISLEFDEEWSAPVSEQKVFGAVRFLDKNTEDRRPGDQGGRLVMEIPILLD